MKEDPFAYLDFSEGVTKNAAIRGTAGSSYQLFMAIGIVGILVALLIIGITLAFSSPAKRADALNELKWKVVVAVALFSMTTLASWVIGVTASFIN